MPKRYTDLDSISFPPLGPPCRGASVVGFIRAAASENRRRRPAGFHRCRASLTRRLDSARGSAPLRAVRSSPAAASDGLALKGEPFFRAPHLGPNRLGRAPFAPTPGWNPTLSSAASHRGLWSHRGCRLRCHECCRESPAGPDLTSPVSQGGLALKGELFFRAPHRGRGRLGRAQFAPAPCRTPTVSRAG